MIALSAYFDSFTAKDWIAFIVPFVIAAITVIGVGIVAGKVASSRGRNPILFGIITPLTGGLGLIILFLLPEKNEKSSFKLGLKNGIVNGAIYLLLFFISVFMLLTEFSASLTTFAFFCFWMFLLTLEQYLYLKIENEGLNKGILIALLVAAVIFTIKVATRDISSFADDYYSFLVIAAYVSLPIQICFAIFAGPKKLNILKMISFIVAVVMCYIIIGTERDIAYMWFEGIGTTILKIVMVIISIIVLACIVLVLLGKVAAVVCILDFGIQASKRVETTSSSYYDRNNSKDLLGSFRKSLNEVSTRAIPGSVSIRNGLVRFEVTSYSITATVSGYMRRRDIYDDTQDEIENAIVNTVNYVLRKYSSYSGAEKLPTNIDVKWNIIVE